MKVVFPLSPVVLKVTSRIRRARALSVVRTPSIVPAGASTALGASTTLGIESRGMGSISPGNLSISPQVSSTPNGHNNAGNNNGQDDFLYIPPSSSNSNNSINKDNNINNSINNGMIDGANASALKNTLPPLTENMDKVLWCLKACEGLLIQRRQKRLNRGKQIQAARLNVERDLK